MRDYIDGILRDEDMEEDEKIQILLEFLSEASVILKNQQKN